MVADVGRQRTESTKTFNDIYCQCVMRLTDTHTATGRETVGKTATERKRERQVHRHVTCRDDDIIEVTSRTFTVIKRHA